jgi:hypothetical protein
MSNPSPWGADAAESVTHSFELILGGDHRLRMGTSLSLDPPNFELIR